MPPINSEQQSVPHTIGLLITKRDDTLMDSHGDYEESRVLLCSTAFRGS